MSEVVALDITDKVATIKLQNGKVNAISHDVIDGLNAAFDQAEEAKAIVVLKGNPGLFSGGFDLKTMQKDMASAMALVTEGSKLARRMLAFPQPIIAVCEGHAVAKGAFLLLCSDYRIGVEGEFKLGLNETAIGMIMHHAGIEMARQRMPNNYFNRSVFNAEMFNPETAVEAGILDTIVPAEKLEASVEAAITHFKSLNPRAFAGTKVKARKDLLAKMDEAIELDANSTL